MENIAQEEEPVATKDAATKLVYTPRVENIAQEEEPGATKDTATSSNSAPDTQGR